MRAIKMLPPKTLGKKISTTAIDKTEHGEKYRRRSPRHRVRQEAVVRSRPDAAHLGPVIKAFDQRHGRHQAQKQDEVLGPRPGYAQTLAGADGLQHVARPGRLFLRLIAHPTRTDRDALVSRQRYRKMACPGPFVAVAGRGWTE